MEGDSFKETKTAVIAGRLSNMARPDAEHALIDVGIETQNSISHNIDYLILGSKGTGGTKHDKVQNLKNGGRKITVLDEAGFDALLKSPKKPAENWTQQQKDNARRSVDNARREIDRVRREKPRIIHDYLRPYENRVRDAKDERDKLVRDRNTIIEKYIAPYKKAASDAKNLTSIIKSLHNANF